MYRNKHIKKCRFLSGFKTLDDRGMLSVEASVVVPLVILVISMMFLFNCFFLANLLNYEEASHGNSPDYADLHRAITTIFDTGGSVYEMLFG